MEFALTVPRDSRTDDSWQPNGSRSFFVCVRLWAVRIAARAKDWRNVALNIDCDFWSRRNTVALRHSGFVQVGTGGTFPWGTLLINLTGCFLLGLIGQITLNRMMISPDWRVAITVGFFGGYTTFSSFGWETAKMLEDGEWLPATGYVAASVVIGLAVVGCRDSAGESILVLWARDRSIAEGIWHTRNLKASGR